MRMKGVIECKSMACKKSHGGEKRTLGLCSRSEGRPTTLLLPLELSHVDAATLRRQYKEVGPMAIQGLDCIPVQPAPAPDQQSDHGEIGNTAATAPPDELALPTDKSDALECEHAKEIQGAAELCIRPSKVAVMKSETELNMKYNAMVTEVVAQRMSKESGGSRESSNPNAGQIRSAAGKAHSAENVSDEASADTEGSSTGDIQSLSCSYSYESSSLTTADDPSMLYPTAASCSYSDDISGSELDYGSLHTASDGWWTENMESSHCVSSVSTGIWLSNCSEPPSSLYSAQSLSSADLVTADLYTGDMETAEAAESDIEAANLVFDMILTAKSESVYPCYTDEINTADSSLVQGDAEVEQHPEAKISHAALCPLDEVQNTT
ncbi:unnamed protein product [Heligmosomoides polygyrus]|uniref:SERTA domain-containing protein n=1 Tax=Heligmosomoides polygyrus TaxID=6339 RepID=A0A183FPZ2_HELPZ|nr:unnamed protein product [Heligmosomoides polygyrus]